MNVRKGFKDARRVMIKVGSNVLTNEQGRLSIGRIGHLVEQIAKLVSQDGKEVILVSSGAVAVGRRRLEFQRRLSRSILQNDEIREVTSRAAASAGQAAFMALYEQMFQQFDLTVGNVLLTHADLSSTDHVQTFANTIDELLKCSIVPVINENDVTNRKLTDGPAWFVDNDSLSAKLATDLRAQLLLLLTDVDGVYTAPPGEKGGYLLDYHSPAIDAIRFGEKSSRGRGGMESKIRAATLASQRGVDVVVASGYEKNVIDRLFNGEVMGTVFTEKWEMQALTPRQTAVRARSCVVELSKKPGEVRTRLLENVAKALRSKTKEILEANKNDTLNAEGDLKRVGKLRITEEQVDALAHGCELLAQQDDPIGKVTENRLITEGLVLQRVTAPLGVMLAIGEVPEVFPQVVAQAIRTGNALLFYDVGGYARGTYEAMFKVIQEALGSDWPKDAIQLIGDEVDLTRLCMQKEHFIDIILPRAPGVTEKLHQITSIPILGAPESICHVFVDSEADLQKAISIILDSKLYTTGPGCHHGPVDLSINTMDTLLVHRNLADDGRLLEIVRAMTEASIKLYGGPQATARLGLSPAKSLAVEWGTEKAVTIELVNNVKAAALIINDNGSGLVETIVTEDNSNAEYFLKEVDSACVFKNASTRFADGYRLGIGAETGVSGKRIYARGPVGLKGLVTSRLIMTSEACHTVTQEQQGQWDFVHKDITPIPNDGPVDAASA